MNHIIFFFFSITLLSCNSGKYSTNSFDESEQTDSLELPKLNPDQIRIQAEIRELHRIKEDNEYPCEASVRVIRIVSRASSFQASINEGDLIKLILKRAPMVSQTLEVEHLIEANVDVSLQLGATQRSYTTNYYFIKNL